MRKKRPAYKPHEEWMIQTLKRFFNEIESKADDHHKVGKLPLEIDLVVVVEKRKSFAKLPPLFRYFQWHNILEIKSEKTRFRVADLQKLQAHGWHYMMKHAVRSPKQVTLTALVHHLPRAVRQALPEYDFQPAGKGIFCRRSHPVSYMIVLKDVPDELLPEELQVFSTRERRMRIFLAALRKNRKSPLLEAMFNLYANEVDQIMMTREEMAQKLVKIAGPKRVAAVLDKKYHLEALTPDDIIAAVLRNKRLLKTLEAKLKSEQKRKMAHASSRN